MPAVDDRSFDVAALIAEMSDQASTAVRLPSVAHIFSPRASACGFGCRRPVPEIQGHHPAAAAASHSIRPAAVRQGGKRCAFGLRPMAELQVLTFDIRRTLHSRSRGASDGARSRARGCQDPLSAMTFACSHRRRRTCVQDRSLVRTRETTRDAAQRQRRGTALRGAAGRRARACDADSPPRATISIGRIEETRNPLV